jgi:hypothetical protein
MGETGLRVTNNSSLASSSSSCPEVTLIQSGVSIIPRAVDGPASLGVIVICSVGTSCFVDSTGGSTSSRGREVIVILKLSGGESLG